MTTPLTTEYRVRIGDDGATQFRSADYGAALDYARNYSRTNSLRQAEIRDDAGRVALLRDGQVTWKRQPKW